MATKKVELPPVTMPAWIPADASALQALARGEASMDQQQRALNWIIYQAAATYDFPFRPGDSDRETNIALGRLFVGQQIVKLLHISTAAFCKKPE